MTSTPFAYARWLQDLTARSVADQQRAAERYTDLMQRVARGELAEQQVRDEFMRFAGEAGTRYASDLAQLSLSYYTALLDLGRTYSEQFYDHVAHGRPHPAQPANGKPARPPRQVQLDLRGPMGQEVTAAFVIENKRSAPAEISFVFSDFVDSAGGQPFRPLLQLQPSRLTLGADAEAEVRLRLPLVPEQFAAGRHYHTKIVVHGYDELELLLNVRVDPAPEPATRVAAVATPQPPSPPDKPAAPTKRTRAKKAAGPRPQRRSK